MVYWQKGNTSQFQVKYTDYPASMTPSVKEKGLPSILAGFQYQLPQTWPFRNQSSPTVWEGSLRLEKLSKHSTVVFYTHSSLNFYRSVWEKEKLVRDEESQHCSPDKNVPREDSQVGLLGGEKWPCVQVPSCSGHPSREPCTPSRRLCKFRAGERGSRCTKDEALVCLDVSIQLSEFRRDEKMCKKVLHVTWSPQPGPPSTPLQDGRRRRKGLGL